MEQIAIPLKQTVELLLRSAGVWDAQAAIIARYRRGVEVPATWWGRGPTRGCACCRRRRLLLNGARAAAPAAAPPKGNGDWRLQRRQLASTGFVLVARLKRLGRGARKISACYCSSSSFVALGCVNALRSHAMSPQLLHRSKDVACKSLWLAQ
jgi:hypothetical protein